eukprot:12938283-Prorocentrum_lima.AAC.1
MVLVSDVVLDMLAVLVPLELVWVVLILDVVLNRVALALPPELVWVVLVVVVELDAVTVLVLDVVLDIEMLPVLLEL